MTSPDLTPAIDLTVQRVTETDLVDAMIAAFQVRVPEWTPTEADTEVALMEAMAVAVGQDVYAINQVPRVALSGLLTLWGVTRLLGAPAVGTVAVVAPAGTASFTMPAGTVMRVQTTDGVVLTFQTSSAATIAAGTSYVSVTASVVGTVGNSIAAGTALVLSEPTAQVSSLSFFTTTTGGADPEPDSQYWARAAAFLQRQSSALVVPRQFESFAFDQVGVGRAKAVSLWDSVGTVGGQTGHVTVAVAGPTGAALSAPAKTTIQAAMSALVVAGLVVHVVDPVFSPGTVTVAVDAQPGVDKPTLAASVQSVVAGWWSAAAWPWGTTLYANDLIGRVAQIPGVLRVTATSGSAVGAAVTSPIGLPPVVPTVTATVN